MPLCCKGPKIGFKSLLNKVKSKKMDWISHLDSVWVYDIAIDRNSTIFYSIRVSDL